MNEREEIERRVIDYSMAVDLNLNRKDTRKALMSAIDRALAERDARIAVLEKALVHERGCDECWKGASCGADCHMNDFALATEKPHE